GEAHSERGRLAVAPRPPEAEDHETVDRSGRENELTLTDTTATFDDVAELLGRARDGLRVPLVLKSDLHRGARVGLLLRGERRRDAEEARVPAPAARGPGRLHPPEALEQRLPGVVPTANGHDGEVYVSKGP